MEELTYLRASYYNLIVGRFMQEDVYQGDGLNPGCNAVLQANALSSTGRISTKGSLRISASNEAEKERNRALNAGTPYKGW